MVVASIRRGCCGNRPRSPETGRTTTRSRDVFDETPDFARGGRAGRRRARLRRVGRPGGRRYDQDRHPAFAVRNHGDQRDDAQRRDADADRRAEQEGRRPRQEARGGGRRSGVQLAAVRRKGQGADREGQGRGRVRLLDLGVPQVGSARLQGGRTRSSSIRSSTRAKSRSATCSTPAPRPTSRRFPPSTT